MRTRSEDGGGKRAESYLGTVEADPCVSDGRMCVDVARKLRADPTAPDKDFSDLYEKMSGRGESAVLSPGRAVVEHRLRFDRGRVNTDIGAVHICRRLLHHDLDRFPDVTVFEQGIHPCQRIPHTQH